MQEKSEILFSEIINIGNELISGYTLNTNGYWLAQNLSNLGFKNHQIVSISDQERDILYTLQEVSKRNTKIIVFTGGLGPTNDDITKRTLLRFFKEELVFNESVFTHVQALFKKRGIPLPETNREQAMVPSCAEVIYNEYGTAPGLWIEKNNQVFIFLPGVPFEMKNIFQDQLIPKIKQKYKLEPQKYSVYLTRGIAESVLAQKIADWEKEIQQKGFELAYLPSFKMIKLRVYFPGISEKEQEKWTNYFENSLKNLIPDFYISTKDNSLEGLVGDFLRSKKQTLSLAESCTGGYLSHLITSVPGSSDYYQGSVTSYSYEIKETILNVKHETLEKYGAVSEQTVIEMAEGVRKLLHTDYSVALSGIAGPGGGTPDKPVGTVWIAVSSKNSVVAKKFEFSRDRITNIQLSASNALDFLLNEMKKNSNI